MAWHRTRRNSFIDNRLWHNTDILCESIKNFWSRRLLLAAWLGPVMADEINYSLNLRGNREGV